MAAEDPTASELFADFLGRSGADFEALCGANPGQAEELKRLRAEVEDLIDVKGQMGLSGPVTEELEEPAAGTGEQGPAGDGADGPDVHAQVLSRLGGRRAAFGRYRMEGEVGRGGQGAVMRVWDEDLRRNLAMKVLLGREVSPLAPRLPAKAEKKKLGRFLEEAQVTGQLDHPGIVPVHELGLDPQGGLYFTMKLVKGENLRTIFRRVRQQDPEWGLTRAITVMLKVCEAVSYAHSKGVVHRDLKPANVMVGRFGEVYVMDWGLARVLGEEERKDIRIQPEAASVSEVHTDRSDRASQDPSSPLVTMEGDVVGTPAFMAPEQARGELDRVGPLADVYSIGAMLYELLAGQMPYVPPEARLNNYAIWGMVQNGPPARIERIAPEVPAELVAICDKAMAREPEARYASVDALRSDLQAFVGGRVVQAYGTGAIVEARKWVQRNRALAAASLSAIALLVVALVFMTVKAGLTADLARRNEEVLRQRYVANLRAAAWSLDSEAYGEAREWLGACPESLRDWEWRHLALRLDQSIAHWQAHAGAVTGLAFDDAGRRLVSASSDGGVVGWDAETGERGEAFERHASIPEPAPEGEPAEAAPVLSLARMEGPQLRLTAAGAGQLRVWDEGGRAIAAAPIVGARAVHAAVPGTDRVVTAGHSVWSDGAPQPNFVLQTLEGERVWERVVRGGLPILAVSPDGEQVLLGAESEVCFYGTRNGALLASGEVSRKPRAMAFDPRGKRAAIGFGDGTIEMWELTGRLMGERIAVQSFDLDARSAVDCLAFSPDGQLLVAGLSSGRLAVASTRTLRVERDLLGHASGVRSIAFAPSGERFASGDEDGAIRIWLGARSSFLSEFDGVRERTIEAVQVSQDGTRVVATGGGVVRVWNGDDATPVARFEAEASAFDPASKRLLLIRAGRRTLVDCASGEQVEQLAGGSGAALLADLSPGARHVAVVTENGAIDLQAIGKEPVPLGPAGTLANARGLLFSPDGKRLLAAGSAQIVAFELDGAGGGSALPGYRLPQGDAGTFDLAWDPRGRYVAFSTFMAVGDEHSRTGRVGVLDLEDGQAALLVAPRIVYGEDAEVTPVSIAFDPEGQRLACSFNDGSVRLWDRATWAETVLHGPAEDWRSITFSPSGTRIWAWTAHSTGIGVFDPLHAGWLLTLPVGDGAPADVAYDDVHDRLLVASGDRKRLLSLDASLESARTLWEAVAVRDRGAHLLETRVQAVLAQEARAEVQENPELDAADRERLLARLAWIGDPSPDELNEAAWEVVDPAGARIGDAELALRWARAAVSLEPDLAEHRETLAWALYSTGRYDDAVLEATEAVKLAPLDLVRDYQDNLQLLRAEIAEQRRRR